MRLITARLFLLAGVLAQGCTGVRAQQSLEVQQHGSSTDQPSASLEAEADGSALIDQSTLPNAIELKGSRPRVDPSAVKPAATSLSEPLSSLGATPSLALPNTTSEVRIRELRPLSLAEVEQLAEVNSPTLKAAASQVEQAKSNLLAALSTWYPTLNLSSTVNYKDSESHENSAEHYSKEGYSFGQAWSTGFGATLGWKLIDPVRVPQIASARDSFEKQRDTYLIALRDLRLNAADLYFQLQRADEGVGIGQNAVRASLVSLQDAQSRLQAGVATKLEVLEAETQLARDTQSLTNSLARQNTRRRQLARLLDLPQDITPTAADPVQIIGIWQPSLEESIVAAYAFREELDSLILDISINNSNANAALAAVQPVITFTNSYDASRSQGQSSGVPENNSVDWGLYNWSSGNTVGMRFAWNIFDGGSAWARYRQNKQKAQQSEFEFAAKRDQLRLEVEESFFNLRASNKDIKTTSVGVLSARESLRLARLRFQAGVTTQREVVNNQRDLKTAQTTYADAMLKYNQSMIQLRRRTGLDQIVACDSLELSNKKPKVGDSGFVDAEVPIKPSPLNPACKASILQAE
ncbi:MULTISPECIES: TolC family protein [unclassified Prochlorococcus]|uniref:TolC family protein n=1 Tax=unclassified Prochlorococcus TaxID=2627481 RepID=UPI0005339F26|nr:MULTISPECIES: TolC family protein [unclassified Prochlorococcus]KGG26262.1 Outer membrane efflux protein precursor [Prochlorococcus sp. MIT 0701]KGG30451.1 Outer membrane efflux protein precursor [Prochlorococcus sp. MIT 0702]KGG34011.1 Outer membrane efflux protein precursor [Prochlorococcus sp. MIT 0703]